MTPSAADDSTVAPVAEPMRIPKRVERNARTSEVIAASIRAQIGQGELKTGDRFPPEDELMEVFGVARTTLREALRILEAEGLVRVLRGRNGGPRVTTPSVDHMARMFALLLQIEGVAITDVHDALAVIEPQLVRQLTANPPPHALAELKDAIDAAAAASTTDDGVAFGEAAAAVHEKIFEHAGNASLSIFARLLHEVISTYFRRSGAVATTAERRRAIRSYRTFFKLVESGDASGAEEHWRALMAYPKTRQSQPAEARS